MRRKIETKFYTVGQNNSGGSLDHDPKHGIGYKVCVEATSAEDAEMRLREITSNYIDGGDCPCCGPRWLIWIDEEDGTEYPSAYGGSEMLAGGWGIPSYIHHIDGQIVATKVGR